MKQSSKSIMGWLSGLALATLTALTLNAADANALLDLSPGQGRFLTPEQRTARHQQVQTTVQELRAKKAAGTITAEELAWLNQAEQRGGWCINGLPARHGPNATPEQGVERRQQMQQWLADLRAKKAAGTITAEEQAWLERAELACGWCINGQMGGPAWNLTPEQLAERQQKMQQLLADLRAKKAAGTITAEEQAWLNFVEQEGGLCVNGVPRGGGFGRGPAGLGRGMGAGLGRGRGTIERGGYGRGGGGGRPGRNQETPTQ